MSSENSESVQFSLLVADNYQQLTKSEKRIANFMRHRQDEAAFLSAGEIADRLGLSEATMVRFARKLGFDSYPALREALQENFRHRMTHSARLRSRLDNLREAGDIFERLVASEIDYLTEALQTLSRDALQEAVKLLLENKRVFVFGLGPSVSLVDLLEVRLTRFGMNVIKLTTAGREMLEPLLGISSKDLLVVIGFFDVSPALRFVLDYAKEMGVPVILITDTLGAIVGDQANVVLAARRGPMGEFHSLVVPMTIINTLLLAMANKDQEKVMANLDRLDQLRERLQKNNQTGH